MSHDHDHEHDHKHDENGDHDHDHPRDHGAHAVHILYIDPIAGASGDMFLGALVDLGVDFDELKSELAKLAVPGFDLVRSQAIRHAIAATKIDVVVEDEEHPHRHVGDLIKIIDASTLSDITKARSAAILTKLAEAEAHVHNMPLAQVHLHEVGGLDCLVDVVGTCIAIELLDVDAVLSGPVALGTGTVACAHGRMPVPAPGTLAILEGFPVRKTVLEGEMTTPTGAAIIATLATPVLGPLVMIPRATGYGAGSKDKPQIANMLRIVLAETEMRFLPDEAIDHDDHDHKHEHDHDHDHGHSHPRDHKHGHSHTH